MKKSISFGSVGLELVSSMHETGARPQQDTPFMICVLGDFSGRSSRGIIEPLQGRKAVLIDRDTIDEVLERMNVKTSLDSAGTSLTMTFSCLDDFHPDHLLNRIGVFKALKEVRTRLGDPRTYNAALKVLQGIIGDAGLGASQRQAPSSPPEGSLLDLMTGAATDSTGKGGGAQPDLDAFLAAVVRPHLLAREDPEQARLTAILDRTISDLMAEVMHHPDFQAVEAAWRGVQFLCSRVETDELLRISLVDISKDELVADLSARDDLGRTGLYRLLATEAQSMPCSLLAGNYTFDYNDAPVLGRMAKIAALLGAPFIARADPCLVGCSTLAGTPDPSSWRALPDRETIATWDNLRHLPEASCLGLAMPRFLLRLPYGRGTDAAETFDFEEMPAGPVHEHYLWGNPAFACACLLAQAFSRSGWDMKPGEVRDIDGLPLHAYPAEGASTLTPCAEVLLTEAAADAILAAGIMPLATLKDSDTALLVRFQSIAEPLTGLSGRWASP
jgi:type VI secretion system protein ImpC